MATYAVNPDAVAHCRALIEKKQYVLDSDWGRVQPGADAQNAYPRTPLVGGVRRLAPRADRGRDRRDEGALRLRLRRPASRPPHRPDRVRLPGLGVAAQGRRARGARPAPAARPHVGLTRISARHTTAGDGRVVHVVRRAVVGGARAEVGEGAGDGDVEALEPRLRLTPLTAVDDAPRRHDVRRGAVVAGDRPARRRPEADGERAVVSRPTGARSSPRPARRTSWRR